jgi:glucokinase
VTAEGAVLLDEQAPTHRSGPGTAGPTMLALIESVLARAGGEVAGIGVGVAGVVDAVTGRLGDEASHVPDLVGRPIAAMVEERFGLPAFVDNDVNALALAEWAFGVGRGARSLVVLAAGTGLGSGVILDGRLVRGESGFGGEFGHAPVAFDGPPCWCGGRGCLAVYASGRGIAEAARARAAAPGAPGPAPGEPAEIVAPLVFARAAAGDPGAAEIIDRACRALGAMIATIVNGLNPEVIVVTGGVAASYLPLEPRIRAAAAAHAFGRALARTRLAIVPGDKRLTVRGAAALVLYETGRLSPSGEAKTSPRSSRPG